MSWLWIALCNPACDFSIGMQSLMWFLTTYGMRESTIPETWSDCVVTVCVCSVQPPVVSANMFTHKNLWEKVMLLWMHISAVCRSCQMSPQLASPNPTGWGRARTKGRVQSTSGDRGEGGGSYPNHRMHWGWRLWVPSVAHSNWTVWGHC